MQLLRLGHGVAAVLALAAAAAWTAYTVEPVPMQAPATQDSNATNNTPDAGASTELVWTDYFFTLLDSPLSFGVSAAPPRKPRGSRHFCAPSHRRPSLLPRYGFCLLRLYSLSTSPLDHFGRMSSKCVALLPCRQIPHPHSLLLHSSCKTVPWPLYF